MRNGAIICFVLATAGVGVAVKNVTGGAPEGVENAIPYAVGSFLLPVVLLIVGLILWGKSKQVSDNCPPISQGPSAGT